MVNKSKKMANRSKKTVLSVRIDPPAKAALDVLAAVRGESLPAVIEDLLYKAFAHEKIAPPALLKPNILTNRGEVSISTLIQFIWSADSALFKLRLHLLDPSTLNERDQTITGTVFQNLEIFGGEDVIFDEHALKIIEDSPAIPKVSLERVRRYWPVLTEYARFLSANAMKVSLPDYIDLLRKSGEWSESFEAI